METVAVFQKLYNSWARTLSSSSSILTPRAGAFNSTYIALGIYIGNFTKSDKFRLTVQSLDLIASHAKHKIWLKSTSEMSFLYGNHVLEGDLRCITENTLENEGVVIYSMKDVPLDFGVASTSTKDCRKLDPNEIVVYHEADIGHDRENRQDGI